METVDMRNHVRRTRSAALSCLVLGVGMLLIGVVDLVTRQWAASLPWLLFGLITLVNVHVQRRMYRFGVIKGRADMMVSMMEAVRREMTFQEWLQAEEERTIGLLREL